MFCIYTGNCVFIFSDMAVTVKILLLFFIFILSASVPCLLSIVEGSATSTPKGIVLVLHWKCFCVFLQMSL